MLTEKSNFCDPKYLNFRINDMLNHIFNFKNS